MLIDLLDCKKCPKRKGCNVSKKDASGGRLIPLYHVKYLECAGSQVTKQDEHDER